MKITGKLIPLPGKVFVSNMEFGEQKTAGGLVVLSANGKADGITPRWGRVWAVGSGQEDVKVGEWILVEHGRWTRTIEVEQQDGSFLEVRMVDNDAIMMSTDDEPTGDYYRAIR